MKISLYTQGTTILACSECCVRVILNWRLVSTIYSQNCYRRCILLSIDLAVEEEEKKDGASEILAFACLVSFSLVITWKLRFNLIGPMQTRLEQAPSLPLKPYLQDRLRVVTNELVLHRQLLSTILIQKLADIFFIPLSIYVH